MRRTDLGDDDLPAADPRQVSWLVLGLSVPTDFWSIVLMLGVLAMLATSVLSILGLTTARGGAKRHAHEHLEPVTPLRVATANAVRERAVAAARAKAAAATRERELVLTDVREVPAGQTSAPGNGRGAQQQPAVTTEEAEAILAHYAEHDPHRLAEVIIQWIKSDVQADTTPSPPRRSATPARGSDAPRS